jgi:flagellum-specific peptidoglycan hydrolase FlgJ
MAGPKIEVSAGNVSGVQRDLEKVATTINRIGREVAQAGKVKFQPVDTSAALNDLKRIEQQFEQLKRVSRSMRDALKFSGQEGVSFDQIDWSRTSLDPRRAAQLRGNAYGYVTRGTGFEIPHAGRPAAPPAESNGGVSGSMRSAVQQGLSRFFSGVGGGAGSIGGSAIGGSMGGGGFSFGGLLRGGLIGAGAFGAYKLGSAVSEGYESAKAQNVDLDTLKRQMGDLGVSFRMLQEVASASADKLGINSSEAAKLGLEFNRLSGGVRDEMDLMNEVRGSVGFGRAFGIDPSQSAGFFGSMRHIGGGDEQSSRRLALLIGETINRSGMNARAGEVLQAIQGFATTTSRLSLSLPNIEGYAGAYAGLLGSKTPGLTSEVASDMLSTANASMSRMGSAGEAGMNFTLAAFGGDLNPVAAGVLAEGGLFGTRRGAFGSGSSYARYMASRGRDVSGLAGGSGKTNFENVRAHLDRLGGDPDITLDAAKRFFGFSSYNQTAAFMNLKPQQLGGLQSLLNRNGVDIGSINETGIGTLASISSASGMGGLDSIYSSMRRRTGRGALSTSDIATLDQAKAGGEEEFRDALVKIAATSAQEETEGSKTRQQMKDIETATTSVGQLLVGPMNTMRDALLVMVNKGGPQSLRRRAAGIEKDDIDAEFAGRISGIGDKISYANGERPSLLSHAPGSIGDAARSSAAGWDAEIARLKAELAAVEAERDARKADVDRRVDAEEAAERKVREARASAGSGVIGGKQAFVDAHWSGAEAAGRALGVDPKLLLAQAGLETGWGKSVIPGTNNLGNIKAGNLWKGATVRAHDKAEGSNDPYRVYGSTDEYWADYVSLIRNKYPGVVGAGSDAGKFAGALKKGGYATDPAYESKIIATAAGMDATPLPAGGAASGSTGGAQPVEVTISGQIIGPDNKPIPLTVGINNRVGAPTAQGVTQ